MVRVIIVIVIVFQLINIGCSEKKKEAKGNGNQEVEINCQEEFFGIDLHKLDQNKLVTILEKKQITYEVYYYEDFPKVPNIVTNYFIGDGLRKDKIRRVMYSFSPFTGKPDIEIEIEGNYLEELIHVLTKKYGKPSKVIKENDKLYMVWRCSSKSRVSAEFLSIDQGRSLKFGKGLGLKTHNNMIYMLLRPKDYGCTHVH